MEKTSAKQTIVSEFYDEIQFPGHYTQDEINSKSEQFYLRDIITIHHLPFKGKILEAGSGSGMTTHLMANTRRDVSILGLDFSRKSIEYATNFSKENNYHNTAFRYTDLNNIDLADRDFDMLLCSGVLHHIKNPRSIFTNLCKLVKKNGLIVIEMYHPWGRFPLHVRQQIFKLTKSHFRWIDPRIRTENWSEQRKDTWFRDQYEHPYERDYSHTEMIKWFDEEGISVSGQIPEFRGNNFSYNLHMLATTGSQGGLFVVYGHKK